MLNFDGPFLKVYKSLKELKLSPTELLIYCQIIEFINNTGTCYMTDAQFAGEYNIGTTTVQRAIQSLENKKLIKRYTTTQASKRVRLLTLYDETDKMTVSAPPERTKTVVSIPSETIKTVVSESAETTKMIDSLTNGTTKMVVSTPQETNKNNVNQPFCKSETTKTVGPSNQNGFIKDNKKINIKDNLSAPRFDVLLAKLLKGFTGAGTLENPYVGSRDEIKIILENNPAGTNCLTLKNGIIKIGDYFYKITF